MGNLFSCCWCVQRDGPVSREDQTYLCGSMRFDCTGRETVPTEQQRQRSRRCCASLGGRDGPTPPPPPWMHRGRRVNIVIAGGAGTGKTLLSAAMASAASTSAGHAAGKHSSAEKPSPPEAARQTLAGVDTSYAPTIGVDVHVLTARCTVSPTVFDEHSERAKAPDMPFTRQLAERMRVALGPAAPRAVHVAHCAQRPLSDDSDWSSSDSDSEGAPAAKSPSAAPAAEGVPAGPTLDAGTGQVSDKVACGWWSAQLPTWLREASSATEDAPRPRRCQYECRAMVWDTAGSTRFVNVILPYVRTADVVVLVYDAGDVGSAKALRDTWAPAILRMQDDGGGLRMATRGAAARHKRSVPLPSSHRHQSATSPTPRSPAGHVVILRNSCAAQSPGSAAYRAWHRGARSASAHAGRERASYAVGEDRLAQHVRDDVYVADKIASSVAARMFAGAPIVCVNICPPGPSPGDPHALSDVAGCLLRALCVDVSVTRAWATRGGAAQYSN